MKIGLSKALSLILAVILAFGAMLPALAADETPVAYTPISYAEDLNKIRNNLSGSYILMNDIDLSGYENWEPIGTKDAPFTGILHGNNKVISNLRITSVTDEGYAGLFGYAENAEFKNICIKDSQINIINLSEAVTRGYVGNLVGFGNSVAITSSVASGAMNVSGFSYTGVGGIIGRINKLGWINYCSNHTDINVEIDSKGAQICVGGISGIATSVERKCSNHGNISVISNDISDGCIVKTGGIDGDGSKNMELSDSYNTGIISVNFSTKETFIGGLSGESYITKNSYNSGEIVCPDNFNGFVGAISGNIKSDVLFIGDGPGMENVYYINDNLSPAYDSKTNFNDLSEDYRDEVFVNVKALSKNEMIQQKSFIGFDFENIWIMN